MQGYQFGRFFRIFHKQSISGEKMGIQRLIQDPQRIETILSKAKFIRIALSDAETPYIVPMSFGYLDNAIYLHSSQKGKKIEMIKKNPKVCFEADIETEVMTAEDPCKYNVRYISVIGHGQAKFLEDYSEKVKGLTVLSEHYREEGPFEFEEWKVNRLCVIMIEI